MTFEEYAYARGPALIRLARLLCGDDHRAEDLVQDVLARAYARWSRIARTERPDLYVRRMLINAHHSWWRRLSNRETSVAEITDQPVPADTAAELADRDELWRQVRALPARQRTVIVLRYYEDLDDAHVGADPDPTPIVAAARRRGRRRAPGPGRHRPVDPALHRGRPRRRRRPGRMEGGRRLR
ncbi:SigE family RNA polymerase sigma factor [Actinoplanes sp. NBC_00393]|uniref:SigE family RNA polymerase sigma factor n=1 Tax=Actinoplanes sp. NBC_00393 TaxID=2975953 RepID=UPI002E2045F2